MFDRADTTKSGRLTLPDLKAALCRVDPQLDESAMADITMMLDLGETGSVSFEQVSVRLPPSPFPPRLNPPPHNPYTIHNFNPSIWLSRLFFPKHTGKRRELGKESNKHLESWC